MLNLCSCTLSVAAFAIAGLSVVQQTPLYGQVGRGGAGTIDLRGLIDASDVIPDEQPANPSRKLGGQPDAPLGQGGARSMTRGDSGDDGAPASGPGASKSKKKRKRGGTGGGGMGRGGGGGGGGGGGAHHQQPTKKTTAAATSQARPQATATPKSAIQAYFPRSQSKAKGVGRRGGVGRQGGIGRQNASGAYTAHHGQAARSGSGGGGGRGGHSKAAPGISGLGGGRHH